MSLACKTINILGATGSIGQSAADVIAAHPERFRVNAVTANRDAAKLAAIAIRLGARKAVLAEESGLAQLRDLLAGHDIEAQAGAQALDEAAREAVDITLAAIVGMAGLRPVMSAVQASGAVAIANKEPLVAAGALIMAAARKSGCRLLPVDSEHNAVFQVFDPARRGAIEKIILTASGGPFRTWSAEDMARASKAQALAHPNWSMGEKISVDSATMMNKALEIIEAHYLFDMAPEKIEVLIHPQSVVHSMVEYCDGSVLAQMGASDMRTPLANVLAWPERLATPGRRLYLTAMASLEFERPDMEKFPAIAMAYECMAAGAHACVAFNAANEVAVEAFLENRIGFSAIMECVRYGVKSALPKKLSTIDDILSYDGDVRVLVRSYITEISTSKSAAAL